MLWIKRNLFLAVGGLVAVLLLGGGVFFVLSGIQKNNEMTTKVEELKGALTSFYSSPEPFPSSNNIETAKKQTELLREAAAKSKKYFTPVPSERVTGLAFRTYRDGTLAELRNMLVAATSPQSAAALKTYAFSFQAQKDKAEFGAGTFPLIPEQMAEVKAICSILFGVRFQRLVNLRRARVSEDDIRLGGTDYHAVAIETNLAAQVVSNPYEITINCYTPELAQIMTAFSASPFGMTLKAIQVDPAEASTVAPTPGAIPQPPPNRPQMRPPGRPPPGQPPANPRPPMAAAGKKQGTDRPVVMLDERPLRVTMLLYVIRPLK